MGADTVQLEHVLGDTWCIVTRFCRIPLYIPDRAFAVMIDSGLKRPDREGILELLKKENIHVAALLTSHFHRDHIGNHSAIKKTHGCRVYMTPYSAIVSADSHNLIASGYETVTMYKARGHNSYCQPDEIIPRDAEELTVCGYRFKLLWLQGHAVEQVGFITPDNVAYLGDTLLSDNVLQSVRLPYYTCGRLDLEAKESLRTLQANRFILAHNGIYDNIDGLIDRNIANILEKLDLVKSVAGEWKTLEQLCVAVMKKFDFDLNDTMRVVGSKRNITVMVEQLVESGELAVRIRDGYVEYKVNQQ